MLHAKDAARKGFSELTIRTVDTVVVVLAVHAYHFLKVKIWVLFGTGKNLRYIPAHDIAMALDPDKCRGLPASHAFTGCNTVSAFSGRGKKTAWAVGKVFDEATPAFTFHCNDVISI